MNTGKLRTFTSISFSLALAVLTLTLAAAQASAQCTQVISGLREPLGTALTEAQASLIRKYTKNVFLLYDSDAAGQKATFRAGDELLRNGASVRVVSLPEGEDPDSFVASEAPRGWSGRSRNPSIFSIERFRFCSVGVGSPISVGNGRRSTSCCRPSEQPVIASCATCTSHARLKSRASRGNCC